MGKKVSLKQIAEAAGVSSALVSMVLNGKAKQYGIGEEAAKKVMAIAEEMHYQPNLMARSLRSGHSHLIGLIVADIANPFFADLARVIEKTANERGYTVVYSSSDESAEQMERQMNSMYNQGIDGIIVVPCEYSADAIRDMAARNYPMVLLDRDLPGVDVPSFMIDNAAASSSMTRTLLEKGFRRISLISYDTAMNHAVERRRGYSQAMRDAGLLPDVHCLPYKDFSAEMRTIFTQLFIEQKRADALIFCTNALTREGLFILRELGLSIPNDTAVFGFDGGDVFDMYDPKISYLVQPIAEMGSMAANSLIDVIEGNATAKSVYMPSSLVLTPSVERNSK